MIHIGSLISLADPQPRVLVIAESAYPPPGAQIIGGGEGDLGGSYRRRIDFKDVCEVTWRILRQLDRDSVRVTRPLKVGFRPEQSYSGDFA